VWAGVKLIDYNGVTGQFLPKGTNFDSISTDDITAIRKLKSLN
jgi:IS30 family transposase